MTRPRDLKRLAVTRAPSANAGMKNSQSIIIIIIIIINWKMPGHDGIHGFWFKKSTCIHDRLALKMNRCLQDAEVPDWMIKIKD